MYRIHEILNSIKQELSAASQKTYEGKKRSELKHSDFLFPETKSFPIVSPADVKDAISNYGRMSGKISYDAFLHKLYNFCKKKGSEFVDALPEASKEKLGIKAKIQTVVELPQDEIKHVSPSDQIDQLVFEKLREFHKAQSFMINPGDKVKNINTSCTHYGSEGVVEKLEPLPDNMGNVVVYKTTNSGPSWDKGDILKKTEVQLSGISIFPSVQELEPMMMINDTMEDSNYLVSDLPINPDNIDSIHDVEEMDANDEESTDESTIDDYKQDFYNMSISSIKAIVVYGQQLLNSLDDPTVQENLTEPWLQSKIAVTEDYIRTIYDFVMFFDQYDDDDTTEAFRKEIKHPRKKHLTVKKPINLSYRFLPVLRPSTIVLQNPIPHNENIEDHDETNEENEEKENETINTPTTNDNNTSAPTDSQPTLPASHKPGLWENIRKKKQREGKNYKPAKPGDSDRPDPKAFKEAQK